MQKDELAGVAADPSEPPDFLQRLPIVDVHAAVAGVGQIEELLLRDPARTPTENDVPRSFVFRSMKISR